MTGVSGFCLKCKTYGPIRDGKMIKMSNGRRDVQDFVLNLGAPVKFLKLSHKIPYRFGYIPNHCGTTARARGLGVMTLP